MDGSLLTVTVLVLCARPLHQPGVFCFVFESDSVHSTKVLWDLLYTSIELCPLDETINRIIQGPPGVYACVIVKHPGVHVTVWLIIETLK